MPDELGSGKVSRNRALSVTLVGCVVGMLAWYVYAYLGQRGLVPTSGDAAFVELMGRTPAWFQGPDEGRFASGLFQDKLEEAAADRFPFRIFVVQAYQRLAQRFHEAALGFLPAEWAAVVPVGGDVLALEAEARLVRIPEISSPGNEAHLAARAAFYRQVAADNPQSRIFVVGVLRAGNWLAGSSRYWKGPSPVLSGDRNCAGFRKLLPPAIGYTWVGEGLSPEEALNLYFRTDHHLSMRGAYRAYRQILSLLCGDGTNLGPALEPKRWFVLPDVAFRGSLARLAGGFDGFADALEDAELDLPQCTVKVSGRETDKRNEKAAYRNGSVPSGRFANHYAKYFGGDQGLVEYVCPASRDRRLLVISDSFDNCLEPLLASHYRKTVFADLRHYRRETGKELDIKALAREHAIDDILFFGDQVWVLGLLDLEIE